MQTAYPVKSESDCHRFQLQIHVLQIRTDIGSVFQFPVQSQVHNPLM